MTTYIMGKTHKHKNNINESYINPRQLNVNTIVNKQDSQSQDSHNPTFTIDKNVMNNIDINNRNSDIVFINNIFNNNSTLQNQQLGLTQISNNNKYNLVKYLGEGIQGSLYLANDSRKKRYICKKINLDINNSNQLKQLEFELNILKYLSSNKVTRKHINPCLDYKIVDNNIFTVFPIFNGYSLSHLLKYLKKLDNNSYYKIIFHLIKTILHSLASIHQANIAHQNINKNSILVSTYEKPSEINVKFTDFGLGCGNCNSNRTSNRTINRTSNNQQSNLINIDEYKNDIDGSSIDGSSIDGSSIDGSSIDTLYKFNSCKVNNFTPITITEDIMTNLVDSDYLVLSQKYDLFCLGIIFIKLLLFFDNLNINFKNGYTKEIMHNFVQLIDNKYLSKFDNKKKKDYKTLFPSLNVSNDVKRDIIEYIKLFKEYILCKTANRKTCQYVLDKLIIYEKYKDEVF